MFLLQLPQVRSCSRHSRPSVHWRFGWHVVHKCLEGKKILKLAKVWIRCGYGPDCGIDSREATISGKNIAGVQGVPKMVVPDGLKPLSADISAKAAWTDEQDLIKDIRQGDVRAFDRVVRRYGDRMYRFILKYIANGPTAEDLTQETFISAYRNISGFNFQAKLSTWLFVTSEGKTVTVRILRATGALHSFIREGVLAAKETGKHNILFYATFTSRSTAPLINLSITPPGFAWPATVPWVSTLLLKGVNLILGNDLAGGALGISAPLSVEANLPSISAKFSMPYGLIKR